MNKTLPISIAYDSPLRVAVALQVILGVLSLMILDGGDTARVCGIALIAFWGGTAVLICRHPKTPTRTDIQWVQLGYLPLIVFTGALVHWLWHLRGLE